MSPFPRWRLAALLPAAALAVTLAGCGTATPAAPTSSAPATAAFPVTIEHKYGATEIKVEPKKIVTLGLSDQDAVLALGVTPVGAVDWFKEQPFGKWPWAKDLWGATPPQIVGERDEYNPEKIAGLAPDLIIAQYSGMKKEQFDLLSKIAPVVAQPKGSEDYQASWQDMTRVIGKALGKSAKADELISGIATKFADIRKAHPEWAGKTIAVGESYEPGKFSAFSPKDPKTVFFTEMGFTSSEKFKTAIGAENVVDFSFERLDIIDGDRMVWVGEPDAEQTLKADPLYAKLAVSKDKRDLFIPYENPDTGSALSFSTVLSIPFAIDQIVPKLAAIK